MVSAAVIARQIGSALFPGSRVERVAKAIAEEGEAEHEYGDHDGRPDDEPVVDEEVCVAISHEGAEAGVGRRAEGME